VNINIGNPPNFLSTNPLGAHDCRQLAPASGLNVRAHRNTILRDPNPFQTIVSQVNFNWGSSAPGSGSPGSDPFVNSNLPGNDFSMRFYGTLTISTVGQYTFYTDSDDGVTFWIRDGGAWVKIIEYPYEYAGEKSGQWFMYPGEYPIALDYYEYGGNAYQSLSWTPPNETKTLIPTSRLSTKFQVQEPPLPYQIEFVRGNGSTLLNWTDTEREAIEAGLANTAAALWGVSNNNATLRDWQIFNNVMVEGDLAGRILFVRANTTTALPQQGGPEPDVQVQYNWTNSSGGIVPVTVTYFDINQGGCRTFAGSGGVIPGGQSGPTPRAIVCNGRPTNDPNPNLIVTEYTVVHELGHIFDNRSQTNSQPGVSVAMGLTSGGVVIQDCTSALIRVFGEYDPLVSQNPDPYWTRGEGGWGSGPSFRRTTATPVPPPAPTATLLPLLTTYQQNARFDFRAKTNDEIYEAAADMFLNWVYRSNTDANYPPPAFTNACPSPLPTPNPTLTWNGFQNREWRGQISNSPTVGNLDTGLSGNVRYYWMHSTVLQIFAARQNW
jgi:hypothetical protein